MATHLLHSKLCRKHRGGHSPKKKDYIQTYKYERHKNIKILHSNAY